MAKNKKIVRIVGASIIAVTLILVALVFYIATRTVSTVTLVFESASLEKIYDGTPLVCNELELVGGNLKEGHRFEASWTGSRTNAGTSNNTYLITIYDQYDNKVSDEYTIDYRFGTLRVIPVGITLVSSDAMKEYDGTPLKCEEASILYGNVISGHSLSYEFEVDRINVGQSDNVFIAKVIDESGNDTTQNYSLSLVYGKLTVYKRAIAIRSVNDEKAYDGEPLANDEWWVASATQPVESHTLMVLVTGERLSVGESPNYISQVIVTDEEGNDVTENYEIENQPGSLVVYGDTEGSGSGGDGSGGDGGSGGGGDGGSGGSGGGGGTGSGGSGGVGMVPDLDESGKIGGGGGGGGGGAGGGGGGGGGGSAGNALRFYSTVSGMVYFRYMSFGDYGGFFWKKASDSTILLDETYSMNYLTGYSLGTSGLPKNQIAIEVFTNNYLLPLYLDMQEYYYDIQSSDVKHAGNTKITYSAYYYMYDYIKSGAVSVDLGEYEELESLYYQYVLEEYTKISGTSNLTYFQNLAKNFSKSDPLVVKKVADYIMQAASYNPYYDSKLNSQDDIVYSFLNVFKEGVCSHFASAATVLYRVLGIPARYVIGYADEAVAGKWVDVSPYNSHAWVEVYIKGMGWVQVEVTAAGPVFGGEAGGGGGDGGGSVSDLPEELMQLTIKPVDHYLKYEEGVVLHATDEIQGLTELLDLGFSYYAIVEGSRSEVGIGYSEIKSFILFDAYKNDVTSLLDITYEKGILQLFLVEMDLVTQSFSMVYDGTTLKTHADDYYLQPLLLEGHSAMVSVIGAQEAVGTSVNKCFVKIFDELGEEVTEVYKINKLYGTLTVLPRELTIAAGSAQKVYDGEPLIEHSYVIQSGLLADGHKIEEITFVGEQTNIGRSENIIDSIKIVNESGKDVTSNYAIKLVSGQLTITPY